MTFVYPGLSCDMVLVVASIGSEGLLGTEALQSCCPISSTFGRDSCGRMVNQRCSYINSCLPYHQLHQQLPPISSVTSTASSHIISYINSFLPYHQLHQQLPPISSVTSAASSHIISYISSFLPISSVTSTASSHIISYINSFLPYHQFPCSSSHIISYINSFLPYHQLHQQLPPISSVTSTASSHIISYINSFLPYHQFPCSSSHIISSLVLPPISSVPLFFLPYHQFPCSSSHIISSLVLPPISSVFLVLPPISSVPLFFLRRVKLWLQCRFIPHREFNREGARSLNRISLLRKTMVFW